MAPDRFIGIVLLTNPPQWLVDTCAGGVFSDDEDNAAGFADEHDAVCAVLMSDILSLATRGKEWDTIPLSPGQGRPWVKDPG